MTSNPHVLFEVDEGVGIVTLNRPEKLNAVTWDMASSLVDLFRELRFRDEVRTIVLTGAGRGFCAGGDAEFVSRLGRKVALNGYNYFVRINSARVDIGLSQFDVPPEVPTFKRKPVEELLISNRGGIITLKLRVPALPAEHTIVQAAAPCSAGISCVQHFPGLGFLPAPTDGWSDITALYVAWHGVPPVGQAVWIRTRQHINGWNDLPKQTSAIVPAP